MVIDLEEFTCAIYGKSRDKSVHDIRYSILKQKCINLERNIDLSQFPPCRKTFSQHIRRVHPQEVLLAQFSLYVHKGGLKPDSFHLDE